jgi:hypothetical protein
MTTRAERAQLNKTMTSSGIMIVRQCDRRSQNEAVTLHDMTRESPLWIPAEISAGYKGTHEHEAKSS